MVRGAEDGCNHRRNTACHPSISLPQEPLRNAHCPSGPETRIAYSLDKITLSDDQVLKIYLYESNGQRNLVLTLTPDDVNLSRRPKN